MPDHTNRREFIKATMLSGAGIVLANGLPAFCPDGLYSNALPTSGVLHKTAVLPFIPNRVASWWTNIGDLQWPQKKIVDKIKRRAEAFAKARIDTAVNFGFHIRFDFSDYFGQLHGYYANVADELHSHGIKFMDHYSCNHIERPKNLLELEKMNRFQRHHVLLYHDTIAAAHAQYEGYFLNDLCQVDVRDGSLGYAPQYQLNTFCHSNPGFLDMHRKYLLRLIKEVNPDGIMVDDMCNYAGPAVCGCKYCRDRFLKEYGHDLPPFGEKSFWGDTTKETYDWGNYDNPLFRDWLRMKIDAIADHLQLIKTTIGDLPLMTCSSNSGPMVLNALSLDLEKLAPHLDFFMLENVGTNVQNVDWFKMDSEALHQKDIAAKNGHAPSMALSYTIYEAGAYFGWALSRYWGVSNWSSTLNGRLEEDPADAMEMEDVISKSNNWEQKFSNINYRDGVDLVEVRLVSNRYCKENGWRDTDGHEHWDRVAAWSVQLVKNNIGYRFVRSGELEDAVALSAENTPLILDGVACLSDMQYKSITHYLARGGIAWLSLPFGTHDEKGFARKAPLSDRLIKKRYANLHIINAAISATPLQGLIDSGNFKCAIRRVGGDARWVVRARWYNEKHVLHFMNTALSAVPHPALKDLSGIPILAGLSSAITDPEMMFEINIDKLRLDKLVLLSPELGEQPRLVEISSARKDHRMLRVSMAGINVYAVAQ